MRRLAPFAALFAAACASAPQQPTTSTPAPTRPQPRETGVLIGLGADALLGRFGSPRLQIREGSSSKMQWMSGSCVLDAYLYPQSGKSQSLAVTHVDSRDREGRDLPQAGCIATFPPR